MFFKRSNFLHFINAQNANPIVQIDAMNTDKQNFLHKIFTLDSKEISLKRLTDFAIQVPKNGSCELIIAPAAFTNIWLGFCGICLMQIQYRKSKKDKNNPSKAKIFTIMFDCQEIQLK